MTDKLKRYSMVYPKVPGHLIFPTAPAIITFTMKLATSCFSDNFVVVINN